VTSTEIAVVVILSIAAALLVIFGVWTYRALHCSTSPNHRHRFQNTGMATPLNARVYLCAHCGRTTRSFEAPPEVMTRG
jgi:hypothetical protein